jgi:hypothetical protein
MILPSPTVIESSRWALSTWVQTIFRQLKQAGMAQALPPWRMAARTSTFLEMGCWDANLKNTKLSTSFQTPDTYWDRKNYWTSEPRTTEWSACFLYEKIGGPNPPTAKESGCWDVDTWV